MSAELGPCNWDAESCAPSGAVPLAEQWVDFAVQALWRATGRQYGPCPVTVRPCGSDCGGYWGGLPFPARLDGQWVNVMCSCVGSCGCGGQVEQVTLPGPVNAIASLWVDGVEVTGPAVSGMVRVDDRRRVVRIDGLVWPTCQNLGAPLTDPGTWGITYERGLPVPAGGAAAAYALAAEFSKACVDDPGCRLPGRVQTITRQGVTVGFQDTFDYLTAGRFGIYEVDVWVASVNLRRGPSRISTPDLPRPREQTWP